MGLGGRHADSRVEQNRLYLDNGRGRFRDRTAIYSPKVIEASTAVADGDLNGDGRQDILVGNAGAGGFERL